MGIRQKMITEKNSDVSPKEVANLRESVVWDRNEEIYPEVLMRHSAYFTSRNSAGKLIGYVSVLSDEVADAFILDLMVDPEYQREGIGLSLVESVLDYVESLGIQCLHVTFQDHLEEFYGKCSFHIFKAGIFDFKHMRRNANKSSILNLTNAP